MITYAHFAFQDFISTINGFEAVQNLSALFAECSSDLLIRLTQLNPKGSFPDLKESVQFFKVKPIYILEAFSFIIHYFMRLFF